MDKENMGNPRLDVAENTTQHGPGLALIAVALSCAAILISVFGLGMAWHSQNTTVVTRATKQANHMRWHKRHGHEPRKRMVIHRMENAKPANGADVTNKKPAQTEHIARRNDSDSAKQPKMPVMQVNQPQHQERTPHEKAKDSAHVTPQQAEVFKKQRQIIDKLTKQVKQLHQQRMQMQKQMQNRQKQAAHSVQSSDETTTASRHERVVSGNPKLPGSFTLKVDTP